MKKRSILAAFLIACLPFLAVPTLGQNDGKPEVINSKELKFIFEPDNSVKIYRNGNLIWEVDPQQNAQAKDTEYFRACHGKKYHQCVDTCDDIKGACSGEGDSCEWSYVGCMSGCVKSYCK